MAGNGCNYEEFLSNRAFLPALRGAERTGGTHVREEATMDKFHLENNCVLWGEKGKH